MESLFTNGIGYTNKAMEIENKISKAIQPIIAKYIADGHLPREVALCALNAAHDAVVMEMLGVLHPTK